MNDEPVLTTEDAPPGVVGRVPTATDAPAGPREAVAAADTVDEDERLQTAGAAIFIDWDPLPLLLRAPGLSAMWDTMHCVAAMTL